MEEFEQEVQIKFIRLYLLVKAESRSDYYPVSLMKSFENENLVCPKNIFSCENN